MVKDNLVPYQELMDLRSKGFTRYNPNAESENEGRTYYYENGKLYYDGQPMYSSSAHSGQIIAATREQANNFLKSI